MSFSPFSKRVCLTSSGSCLFLRVSNVSCRLARGDRSSWVTEETKICCWRKSEVLFCPMIKSQMDPMSMAVRRIRPDTSTQTEGLMSMISDPNFFSSLRFSSRSTYQRTQSTVRQTHTSWKDVKTVIGWVKKFRTFLLAVFILFEKSLMT